MPVIHLKDKTISAEGQPVMAPIGEGNLDLYLALVEEIRRRHAGIALSTDIICGFCSETDEEFFDTYRIMQDVQYDSVLIDGAPNHRMRDQPGAGVLPSRTAHPLRQSVPE